MIILIYGQSGSGKTTISNSLQKQPVFNGKAIKLDGDEWREITNNKTYDKESRLKNLQSAFSLAINLENQGFIPILSFVCPYEQSREYLRSKANKLVEVYLKYTTDRGKNSFSVKDFELPIENNNKSLILDTTKNSLDFCLKKIIQKSAK